MSDDRDSTSSGPEILQKFAELTSEAMFQALRNVQRANVSGGLGAGQLGLGAEKLQAWLGRGSNIAFESTLLGLNTWKHLLELSRRFEPEVLAGQMAPHAVWLDPAARLEADEGILVLQAPNKERPRERSCTFTVANRSKHTLQINLPKVLELRRATDGAIWPVELMFDADDPVLMPGDDIKLQVMVTLPKDFPHPAVGEPSDHWFGPLAIRTRGPLHVQLMFTLEQAAAAPSPVPAPVGPAEPKGKSTKRSPKSKP